jgi:hypothetical protein
VLIDQVVKDYKIIDTSDASLNTSQ